MVFDWILRRLGLSHGQFTLELDRSSMSRDPIDLWPTLTKPKKRPRVTWRRELIRMETMDSNEMVPGRQYIIDGKIWVKCGRCKKILKVGIFGALHLCV